jgi:hypothetical protein
MFYTLVTSIQWKNLTFLWMGPSAGFWLLWRGEKSMAVAGT